MVPCTNLRNGFSPLASCRDINNMNDFVFSEEKGGKRVVGITPRLLQLRRLAIRATGLNDTTVNGIYNYGCWCGPRGEGKVVDNFD